MHKNLSSHIFLIIFLALAVVIFIYAINFAMLPQALVFAIKNKIILIKDIFLHSFAFILLVCFLFVLLWKKSSKLAFTYLISLFFLLSIFSFEFTLSPSSFGKLEAKLSAPMLNIIQDKTIDIFPTDFLLVKENKLNWLPRPQIFSQLQGADTANSIFLQSQNAPEHLLIKNMNSELLMQTFNDNPQTFYQLLNHYKLRLNEEGYLLYEKSVVPNYPFQKNIADKNLIFNSWRELPVKNADLILLQILPQKTFWANIIPFSKKISPLIFEYKLSDNNIKKISLEKSQAPLTILASPYLQDLNLNNNQNNILAVKISTKYPCFYEKTAPISWVVISHK